MTLSPGYASQMEGDPCGKSKEDRFRKGLRDAFWLWSMQVGFKAAFDCIKAFSETDLTEDLKKFDTPLSAALLGEGLQARREELVRTLPIRLAIE